MCTSGIMSVLQYTVLLSVSVVWASQVKLPEKCYQRVEESVCPVHTVFYPHFSHQCTITSILVSNITSADSLKWQVNVKPEHDFRNLSILVTSINNTEMLRFNLTKRSVSQNNWHLITLEHINDHWKLSVDNKFQKSKRNSDSSMASEICLLVHGRVKWSDTCSDIGNISDPSLQSFTATTTPTATITTIIIVVGALIIILTGVIFWSQKQGLNSQCWKSEIVDNQMIRLPERPAPAIPQTENDDHPYEELQDYVQQVDDSTLREWRTEPGTCVMEVLNSNSSSNSIYVPCGHSDT